MPEEGMRSGCTSINRPHAHNRTCSERSPPGRFSTKAARQSHSLVNRTPRPETLDETRLWRASRNVTYLPARRAETDSPAIGALVIGALMIGPRAAERAFACAGSACISAVSACGEVRTGGVEDT